ncbi:MAG: hypothetical protein JSS45_03025 [Proteobacteria bacterium]|nr:hypothetical protein [Pseudomonadota bacterium]
MTFPTRYRTAALLLLVSLTTTAVYWPGLRGSYLFDDFPNIVDNQALHIAHGTAAQLMAATQSSIGFTRPLAMLSFAINYLCTGLDPWPMKFTNLLIHVLNGLLLFGMLRTLLRLHARAKGSEGSDATSLYLPLAVTAGWLLLPINLTGVLYVVQRMESLCQLAVLGGLWAYLRGRERMLTTARGGGFAIACSGLLLGLALGLASKESAVLLPAYAVTVEWALLRWMGRDGRPDRRLRVMFTLILILPAALGLAWLLPKMMAPAAYASRTFTLTERLLTEPRVLVDYLRWTVLPDPRTLSFYHDDYAVSRSLLDPSATLAAIALLSTLLGAAIALRKRRPLMALGIVWFFIAHLLTATFIPLELVFEHRNYFASIGVLLALFALLLGGTAPGTAPGAVRWQSLRGSLVVVWIMLFTGATWVRAQTWSNPVQLAIAEANLHPTSMRANYEAARQLIIVSDYKANSPALNLAWKFLDRAASVPGSSILYLQAMVMAQDRSGGQVDPLLWQRMIKQLQAQPTSDEDISALESLTNCRARGYCRFQPEPLDRAFRAALSRPFPRARLSATYASFAWRVLHDAPLADRYFHAAVSTEPSTAVYRADLARLLVIEGRSREALEQVAQLKKLNTSGQLDQDIAQIMARIDTLAPARAQDSSD